MERIETPFGSGELLDPEDVTGSIYAMCTACMSILSEHESWAQANIRRAEQIPELADNILILGCQVTDIAILNDLRYLESLMEQYPGKNFLIGGCLARRFDIAIPEGVGRIGSWREDYEKLLRPFLTRWAKPFWVPDFEEQNQTELDAGHIFRDQYPLRISVGCKRQCAYCTIKHTRGEGYELDPLRQINEFLGNEDVVLIADSPSADVIRQWCQIAKQYNKPISIRNVDPTVANMTYPSLREISDEGLLRVLHVPIQSDKKDTLKDMRRPCEAVTQYINNAQGLRNNGTILATNVIIDYKEFPNPDMVYLGMVFDYISWNPYWDGKWDREKAEARWEKYITNGYTP
jgi:tRNA A37 methylthiotransferase MiaB